MSSKEPESGEVHLLERKFGSRPSSGRLTPDDLLSVEVSLSLSLSLSEYWDTCRSILCMRETREDPPPPPPPCLPFSPPGGTLWPVSEVQGTTVTSHHKWSLGMDDADGAFITKTRFLQHWRENPAIIVEPYNIDTEENVIHFLARSATLYTGIFYWHFIGNVGRENWTFWESSAVRMREMVLLWKVWKLGISLARLQCCLPYWRQRTGQRPTIYSHFIFAFPEMKC